MKPLGPEKERILLRLARVILGPVEPAPSRTSFLSDFHATWESMPPRDRRLLSLLIHLVQLSPIFWLAGRNLTGLSLEAGERHMQRLAASRLPFCRRGVAVLRTLVAYHYYGQSESWESIGYGGPWLGREEVEVLPEPELELDS